MTSLAVVLVSIAASMGAAIGTQGIRYRWTAGIFWGLSFLGLSGLIGYVCALAGWIR